MEKPVAYFSAEYGLPNNMPIYAGGLGILAGDILREASELSLPFVAVGVLYKKGFFKQALDKNGWQEEKDVYWNPEDYGLDPVKNQDGSPLSIILPFPKANLNLLVWKNTVGKTFLYLLDADNDDNPADLRDLTSNLYTGDWNLHLEQEYILGVGGVRLLRELKIESKMWHLNDDHSALSLLERLRELVSSGISFEDALSKIKETTLFTTHTPVRGAESVYDRETVLPFLKILSGDKIDLEKIFSLGAKDTETFSLSLLGISLSGYKNAVSKRHHEISESLWDTKMDFVTNGVSSYHWVSNPMKTLYDNHLGTDWQSNINSAGMWQKVYDISDKEFWSARLTAKKHLISYLLKNNILTSQIDENELFIGFARRFAPYKQSQILISSMSHLKSMLLNSESPAHLFVSGKAHPIDNAGKKLLQEVYWADNDPKVGEAIVFCENYDIPLAKMLVSGVDLWLNTPKPPMEASGTSGMKAMLNGAINASTLDGWWYEAFDGNNGWVVGSYDPEETAKMSIEELNDNLFYLLESEIIPLYYDLEDGIPVKWIKKIKDSLVTCAPRFNTRRMLLEYKEKFYDRL
ncbi:hypothetical protein COT51_03420 [candidate division WWE3 bacterium CG08_land_8_20_14_0_20_41_15]|uniref:glycogen phosphorylase n=1 Tax=candidate division WWE3 bacterium CG08_land_8_20_14_0_20_41_15 TaxID=1975086 RepID=A0A2H0X8P8_UNCKA|nr:MAG: hypothetical protein COT51_03420 [candidate division WWE3 bacterium CG08_land_8_20_14_0_20_41_15]